MSREVHWLGMNIQWPRGQSRVDPSGYTLWDEHKRTHGEVSILGDLLIAGFDPLLWLNNPARKASLYVQAKVNGQVCPNASDCLVTHECGMWVCPQEGNLEE